MPWTAIALALIGVATPQNGDIVFQQSRSSQSAAIALATKSRYTHMGIVTVRDGKPFVFEAVQPVKLTPYAAWVARGVDKHVVVKRLALPLSSESFTKMAAIAETFKDRNYDLAFAWDDDRMYCSELVYKIYDRGAGITLGTLQRLRDFDLSAPAVRKKLHERYGDAVPLDEVVISPQAIFDDPKLITVD